MQTSLKFYLTVLLIVFSLIVVGCDNSEEVKRDVIPKLMEKIVSDTQKAILEKDAKLARETWSKVTEFSVKAKELGDEELSEALCNLATTYVNLIEYCENGEDNSLKVFNTEFAKALEKIKTFGNVVKNTGYKKPVFFLINFYCCT